MLSPGPSVRRISKTKGRKKRYTQPQDIREGMANAYSLVKEVSCVLASGLKKIVLEFLCMS